MSFEVFFGRVPGHRFTMTLNGAEPLGARRGEWPFNETDLLPETEAVVEAVASTVIEQLSDPASVEELVQNSLNGTAALETVGSAGVEQLSDPASEGIQNALSNVTSAISSLTSSTSTVFSNLIKNFNLTKPATRVLNSSKVFYPAETAMCSPAYSIPNATNATLEKCTGLVKRAVQSKVEPGENILLLALGALGLVGAAYYLYKRLFSSAPKPTTLPTAPVVPQTKPKREPPLRVYVKEIPKEILNW